MSVGGRLYGRVALVTGAARGIGRAIALAFAREGAAVVINEHRRDIQAKDVMNEIVSGGGEGLFVRADVSEPLEVDGLVSRIHSHYGRLDVLVNNAALTNVHKPWTEITPKEWDEVLATNLRSCFLCFRASHGLLKQSGRGRVINISSVTALLGQRYLLHYVSSKGGMIAFTRALAREVGVEAITVNAITPGAILTEAEAEAFPGRQRVDRQQLAVQSLKRRGLPEDIAGVAVFLASDDASFITGQTINVDGGWAMH